MRLEEKLNKPVFKLISSIGQEMGTPVFVIGGYVRDLILDRLSEDIDIVVHGSGIELARKLAEKLGHTSEVQIYKNFGTALVHHGKLDIEFV